MAPRMKERLTNAFIMFCSGSAVALVAFWLDTSEVEAREIKNETEEIREELNKKADRTELNKYISDHKIDHLNEENRITKHFDKRFDDFKDFMLELNKKQNDRKD